MRHFSIVLTSVLFVAAALFSQASAQVMDVTFSRPDASPPELGVSEVRFEFGTADTIVQIDQLGPIDALFQNNDSGGGGFSGQDFGVLTVGDPIESIGVVSIGDVLNPGTDFVSTGLEVSDIISRGENFFLAFSTGTSSTDTVGYFNIAWELGDDSDIVYTGGRVQIGGGGPLLVAAVPEPGSLVLLSAFGFAAVARRRRRQ